jgi:IclR family transcriptional regulator, pca regulon regulatory protein
MADFEPARLQPKRDTCLDTHLDIRQAQGRVAAADWIEGAARALTVLESFSAERQRLSITQVAERAGLTRAAARRHVLTLEALGYLQADEGMRTPSYWLSHRVLRLAGNYLASARLPRVAQPTLNRLALQTGHAFSVAVLDGAQAVIVARSGEHRISSQVLPYGVHLGARLAAFATSTGRVLLSSLSATDLKTWLVQCQPAKLTMHTVTDKRQLQSLVKAVAAQGFSEVHQEHELGVYALAVPVHDAKHRVVAAMNLVLSNAKERPPKDPQALRKAYLPLMQAAAAELRLLL